MPLKLFRRGKVFHYRGTPISGDRLRGSTGETDRKAAKEAAAAVERAAHQHHSPSPRKGGRLTFPKAVELYLSAGKPKKYLPKIIAYWKKKAIREGKKETLVKDMTAGLIRQSAIDLYPGCSGATLNRQVITPTQAIINHCAELELCSPVRIKRFKFTSKIKEPVTLKWVMTLAAHARPVIKALAFQMFATAERFCEAHATAWADYNFEQRTVRVRDTKTGNEDFAHMPQPLLIALANLPRDKPPFFWSETTLRIMWDEDVAKTAKAVPGFRRLTFHCCRHGFATKMLRDGIDPKTAAGLGRWKDLRLFLETYAHAMPNATLTEGLFDTKADTGAVASKEINSLQK